MKTLAIVTVLVLVAMPQRATVAEPAPTEAAPTAPVPIGGRCGSFVVWTALHFDDDQTNGYPAPTAAALRFQPIEFWSGPYGSDRNRAVEWIATRGSWGSRVVDGFHHSGYLRDFYPPARIVRVRWVHDCLR